MGYSMILDFYSASTLVSPLNEAGGTPTKNPMMHSELDPLNTDLSDEPNRVYRNQFSD